MSKETRDQKKEIILASALSVMTKKGYYNSTMDDIVKESKMSKGAIYHYFSSKKEVYLGVIDYWEEKYTDIMAKEINKQKTAMKSLKALFKTFGVQMQKDPTPYECLPIFRSISRNDKEFKNAMQKVYNRFQKAIELIIETGVKNKEFKRVDPKTAALALILNIEGIFWFTLYKSNAGDASVYMNTISDYILNLYKA